MAMVRMSDLPDAVSKEVKHGLSLYSTTHQKLHQVLPAGVWKGRRVFIVAGGPSLKGFDFDQLKGEIVIAINRSMEYVPWATVMLCQDSQVWGWYEDRSSSGYFGDEANKKWKDFKGYKTWLNVQAFPYPEDLHIIDVLPGKEWDMKSYANGIPMTNNSGMAALHLAVVLGASEIYLLGYDMKGKNGRTADFHGGYVEDHEEIVYDEFSKQFGEWADRIKAKTKVVNLNPASNLPYFEKGTVLDLAKRPKHPLYVSFFTPNYETKAKILGESLRRYGLEHELTPIELKENWLKTIYWRPEFLLQKMKEHKRDLVWVDSDAEIMKYPDLFDDTESWDVGVHHAKWPDRADEYLGGTIYLAYNKLVIEFLEYWIALNKRYPKENLSQVVLKRALDTFDETRVGKKRKLTVRNLPATYCQIYDLMADAGEPVIHHYQASRQFRKGC